MSCLALYGSYNDKTCKATNIVAAHLNLSLALWLPVALTLSSMPSGIVTR